MNIIDLPGTYVHQLDKPANRLVLEAFKEDRDKDVKKFIRLFLWLIATLRETPAWNKPKTNIELHKIKEKLEATITGAKRGTSSSYAVAGYLIGKIEYCRNLPVSEAASRQDDPGIPVDLELFEEQLKAILAAVENSAAA